MKIKIKKLWLSALRSGKYQQGKGSLKTNEGKYCCLGVLTELYRAEHKTKFKTACKESDGDFQDAYLPEKVMKWSGISENNPKDSDGIALSTHNDGRFGRADTIKNFSEIANIIEKDL